MKQSTKNRILRIKEQIKNKFGSVWTFCVVADYNYWTATNAINGRTSPDQLFDRLNDLERLIHETQFDKCGRCIEPNDRQFITNAINGRFKTVTNFCNQHTQFSITFVHNVISGKRKIRDQRVQQLIEILST